MVDFGIRFSSEIRGAIKTPAGFCAGEISLGNHKEICFSDCSQWNSENYIEHWKVSAKGLVHDNLPKLFCSSLERVNAVLWIGIPSDEIVVFYNRICKVSDLQISDLTISPRIAFPDFIGKISEKWSRWEVNLDDLKYFSRGE